MENENTTDEITIRIATLNKERWLTYMTECINLFLSKKSEEKVIFEFDENLDKNLFMPFHLVTLACFIQFLSDNRHHVAMLDNGEIAKMICNKIKFSEYWLGGKNHVETSDNRLLNLWRIVDTEKDIYANEVESYFKNNYFKNKDLSRIHLSLTEMFYNVFDHAEANGNAFSFVQYDDKKEILHVAICDFGKGIAKSVRSCDKTIKDDKKALLRAIQSDFTSKSKTYNMGKGLDIILQCSDIARIVSNNALLYKVGNNIKAFNTNFCFSGTLIYIEINLQNTDNVEIIDELDF